MSGATTQPSSEPDCKARYAAAIKLDKMNSHAYHHTGHVDNDDPDTEQPNDCDSKTDESGTNDGEFGIDGGGTDDVWIDKVIYHPLDLDRPAIRLLRLLKGRDPLIPCELFQAWVSQREVAISYEALSYVWGSPARGCHIVLNNMPFGVTKNLHQALRHLQLQNEDRIIWVDAICINQRSEIERGHQVRHMSDVYREAARVIYWLGLPTSLTDCCLRGLQLLQKETRDLATRNWSLSQWMAAWKRLEANNPRSGLEREGLRELLNRSWFRRVWILQEVASSQAAIVCSGTNWVWARIFALAPFLMEVTAKPHCQGILDMMPGPFRKSSCFHGGRDLYTLLGSFAGSESTEDRDLVYALLGLSSDAIHVIQPDYQMADEDVVSAVFSFLFRVPPDRSLGIFPASIQELCVRLEFFNQQALEVAAMDEIDGDTAIAFNLDRCPDLAISEQTMRAAARNKRKAKKIVSLLLANFNTTSQKFTRGHGRMLVEGAAENDVCGYEVLKHYVSRTSRGLYRHVSDRSIILAACNKVLGGDIMGLLLELLLEERWITSIPEEALVAAIENDTCGYEIVSQFLKRGLQRPRDITERMLRAAASSGPEPGGRTLSLLLEYSGLAQNKHRNPLVDMHQLLQWIAEQEPYMRLIEQAIESEERNVLWQLVRWTAPVAYERALMKAYGFEETASIKSLSTPDAETPSTAMGMDPNQTARAILEHEKCLHVPDQDDLLHTAVTGGFCDLAESLIMAGANVNSKNRGDTPLHLAIRAGDENMVEVLVRNGADLESRNSKKLDPLSLAACIGRTHIIQHLVSAGADTESISVIGYTPLLWAAKFGQTDAVSTLLRTGANIKAKTRVGSTALHLAARYGHLAVVEVLLMNGADMEEKEGELSSTPLYCASSNGHTAIAQFLLARGARRLPETPETGTWNPSWVPARRRLKLLWFRDGKIQTR